jgi:hypothetical protein
LAIQTKSGSHRPSLTKKKNSSGGPTTSEHPNSRAAHNINVRCAQLQIKIHLRNLSPECNNHNNHNNQRLHCLLHCHRRRLPSSSSCAQPTISLNPEESSATMNVEVFLHSQLFFTCTNEPHDGHSQNYSHQTQVEMLNILFKKFPAPFKRQRRIWASLAR